MYTTELKIILEGVIFHISHVFLLALKISTVFIIVSILLVEPIIDSYKFISSEICTQYSDITKNEVKYFGVVGCFERVDNNWVKVD